MRILITRPREDAAALADKLRSRGHDVLVEPMLEIRLAAGASVDLAGVQAVLFTSANGVRAFAAAAARRDVPAFCVGDTTAAMAREAGFATVESAAGNVEDLARLVRARLKPEAGALLHAAGAAVAGDLAGSLGRDGFELRRAVLYAAEPVASLSPVTAAALKARQVDLVVFFSARSAETFARLVRAAGLAPALARTVALGLSPAVLQAVAGLPWAMTEAARQPQEADLIRAIARHKIIAQLEGAPADEETPEVVFGRRADDPADQKPEQKPEQKPDKNPEQKALPPSSTALPATPARPGRLVAVVAWLAAILSLGTFALLVLQGERPAAPLAPAVTLRLETRLAALERQIAGLPAAGAPQADATAAAEERLAALAGRLAALENRPPPPPPTPAPPDPGLLRRLAAMEEKLAAATSMSAPAGDPALGSRLQALEEKVAAQANAAPPADPALGARLAAVEEKVAALAAAPPPPPAVPEAFAARVAALEAALEARPDIGQIAAAMAENRRLAGEIARLQEQVALLGAGGGRPGPRDGLLLAVGQLREAARQGRPFPAELATAQALAGDDPALAAPLAALSPLAARAVPTRDALGARFAAVAAAAGRAAQVAALAKDAPPDDAWGQWWNGVVERLTSLVAVRRVGEVAGDTPAARLARAEQAVAAGDLAAAVAALEGLAGTTGEAVAAWRSDARARLDLDRATEGLLAAALAAAGSGP